MTTEEIFKLEELCAKVPFTQFDFQKERSASDRFAIYQVSEEKFEERDLVALTRSQAELYNAARTAVPKLLEERKELIKALERISYEAPNSSFGEHARAALEKTK